MSTQKFETFSYTPIELAASMTGTVNDSLVYLYRQGYIKKADYENLSATLAVYPMPNRRGFGQKLLERFFGQDETESAFVFPIVEIDPVIKGSVTKDKKPTLNVVEGDFGKDKKED